MNINSQLMQKAQSEAKNGDNILHVIFNNKKTYSKIYKQAITENKDLIASPNNNGVTPVRVIEKTCNVSAAIIIATKLNPQLILDSPTMMSYTNVAKKTLEKKYGCKIRSDQMKKAVMEHESASVNHMMFFLRINDVKNFFVEYACPTSILAAQEGEWDYVMKVLPQQCRDFNPEVDTPTSWWGTKWKGLSELYHYAIYKRKWGVVNLIEKMLPSVNLKYDKLPGNYSAFDYAITRNDIQAVQEILNKGIFDLHELNKSNRSPLWCALRDETKEIAKLLISYGVPLTKEKFDLYDRDESRLLNGEALTIDEIFEQLGANGKAEAKKWIHRSWQIALRKQYPSCDFFKMKQEHVDLIRNGANAVETKAIEIYGEDIAKYKQWLDEYYTENAEIALENLFK